MKGEGKEEGCTTRTLFLRLFLDTLLYLGYKKTDEELSKV